MADKTSIANRALSIIGSKRVSNIETTDTKPARVINEMYDEVRDAMLTLIPWNFAVKRTSLAPDGTAPSWGWTYAYTPPADFMSLYRIRYNPKYEFEDNKILTDEGTTLYIKYIYKQTNEAKFSPLFAEALGARLGYEICEIITQSNTKKAKAYQNYLVKLDEAARVDSLENPLEDVLQDEWVTAREDYSYITGFDTDG